MKSIYALIAACSLCFVCVACEDDIPDQTHEPQIHKIVGELHDNLSTKSSCANMLEGIESFAGAYDDDVYEMLVELGVTPYAAFEENHQLLTQTRED